MKKLQKLAASMLPDLAGLAGVGMMSYGAWLIAHAAGYIVFGALLVTLVVLYARGATMTDRQQRAVRAAAARVIALLGRAVRADAIGNSHALLARLEEIGELTRDISALCGDSLSLAGRAPRKRNSTVETIMEATR